MPTYRINGIDRETRLDTRIVVNAASRHEAIDEAMVRGVMPGEVEMIGEMPIGAAPAALPVAASLAGPIPGPGSLHPRRLLLTVAAVVGASATFMPWADASILGKAAGSVGPGWISFAAFVLVLALTFSLRIFDHPGAPFSYRDDMSQRRRRTVAMVGLASVGFGAWMLLEAYGVIGLDRYEPRSLQRAVAEAVRPGFGLFVMLFAGVATVWLSLMRFPPR